MFFYFMDDVIQNKSIFILNYIIHEVKEYTIIKSSFYCFQKVFFPLYEIVNKKIIN